MRLSYGVSIPRSFGLLLAVALCLGWAVSRADSGEAKFRAFDGFDGELALEWKPVRPDPTHVSLEKNPGKLTITTQRGSIHGAEKEDAYGAKIQAKNLYLIRNPADGDGDFVATTCVESFSPQTYWQQAGLMVYDDDDNYIKWDLEWHGGSPAGVTIVNLLESEQRSDLSAVMPEADFKKCWLRLTKRGDAYEHAYSTDGKTFIVAGEKIWGNGAPKRIGVFAKNGGNPEATDIDAAFDFFEVRSPLDAEKDDPDFVERKKLRGTWEVVSCKLGGKPLTGLLSRFAFEGMNVTIWERAMSLEAEYKLDVAKEPKGLTLSALSSNSKGPVRGLYAIKGDTLVICQELDPETPVPSKLETLDGDHRLLVTLRRMSETEAAAIERYSLPREEYFGILDKDGDGQLSLDEVLVDYPTPEAVKQGTESFNLMDKDHDGRLSVVEFTTRPHKVSFMQADLDANGVLSEMEFTTGGSLKTASAARAHRVFGLIDQDSDGVMSLNEYLNRARETWFVVFDADENNLLSYNEYANGNPGLVRVERCEAVFAAIDRDSDGRLTMDEHVNKPREAYFVHMDRDGDERVTFKEFTVWKNTPQKIEEAKKDFENRDADGDERLTIEEFTGKKQ